MKAIQALAGGLAGACVLTLTHETLRRYAPHAPRMDVLGMQAISKIMKKAGAQPPQDQAELHNWAMAGDMIANTLYYSLAGTGKGAWWRGTLLGASAGAGAIGLPGPLGLSEAPSNRTSQTRAMTVGLYLLGGIVAGAVGCLFGEEE